MISAIVLAAGRSRRMGVQKLLLPFAGQTVIGHVVEQVLAAAVGHVLVVVPEDGDSIRSALAGKPVTFLANPNPRGDMLSSVRCGLRELPAGCTAVLVVLGDQPAIAAKLISELIAAFQATEASIIVPTHDGRRGHPILFSTEHVAELLTNHAGSGLRGLLEAHPSEIHLVKTADPAVLADMDDPADYERELARLMHREQQPEA